MKKINIILFMMMILLAVNVSASFCTDKTGAYFCNDFEGGNHSDWTDIEAIDGTSKLEGTYSIWWDGSPTPYTSQWDAPTGPFNISYNLSLTGDAGGTMNGLWVGTKAIMHGILYDSTDAPCNAGTLCVVDNGARTDTGIHYSAVKYIKWELYNNGGVADARLYINGVLTNSDIQPAGNNDALADIRILTMGDNGQPASYMDNILVCDDLISCTGSPPPPIWPLLNLTIDYPPADLWYGIDQLYGNHSNLWLNLTHNATGSYTTTVNDTRYSLDHNTSTEIFYRNNTAITTSPVHLLVYLNQSGTGNASDSTYYTIDLVNPNIIPQFELDNNLTYVWNGTLVTNINFTDDQEIYSINVSFCNGTVIFNDTNMGVSSYALNISYGVDPTILGCINTRLCDSHTNEKIKDIPNKQTGQGLTYVMDSWLWIAKDWVTITPKDPGNNYKASTEKKEDRYSFTIARANTYIVESSHFIDITKKQLFDGHLVIPGIGENGYWIDFTNPEANTYHIKRISPTKIEITITGLTSDLITFNSIGELNCLTDKYWYNNLNPTPSPISDIISGVSRYFNLSVTSYPGFITSINTTALYNKTLYYGGTSSNFSVPYTAPAFYGLNIRKNLTWTLDLNGNKHNLTQLNHTIHNTFLDNCTNSSFYDVARVYFRNAEDQDHTIVNHTLNIEGDLVYSNTQNNDGNYSLCAYPNFVNLSESISIQFARTGTNQYFNLDTYLTNSSITIINLYVQAGTSTTLFTIKDKDSSELLQSVYGTMYRKVDGTWTTMESKYSDISGKIQFSYVPYVEYKFLLTKDSYSPYTFNLNPILFTEYDILMEKDVSNNQSQDFDKTAIYYYPKEFYNGRANKFTFMIHNPYAELDLYGYTLIYPGGTKSNSGTNTVGEILNNSFTIVGATNTNRVRIDYYYETDIAGLRNFTAYHSIIVGNNTMVSNRDNTYGLGILERIFISVVIVMLVVGIATLIGQPVAGFGFGLLIFGFLSFIGFVPLWAILLPVTVGFIILGSQSRS